MLLYFQLSIELILFPAPTPPPPVTGSSVALLSSPAGSGWWTGRLTAVTAGTPQSGQTTDRTEAEMSVEIYGLII